jgi:8-oxo-dGTP pyrophosphatase MutT (NUDIX family)
MRSEGRRRAPVFLGLDMGEPRFAVDISDWEPEEVPDTVGAFFDPSEQRHPLLTGDHVFAELRGVMTRLDARSAEFVATAKAILGWHETHGHCARCGAKSRIVEAGWQRHCPDCGARHFPRTDPVVIMLILSGNDVLMGRSPGWPEGMYSLLAGFVEPGESLEAAVRREVREETGVEVGAVGYLASQPWPFPASLMVGCRGEALSPRYPRRPRGAGGCALGQPGGDAVDLRGGEHRDEAGAARVHRPFPDLPLAGRQSGVRRHEVFDPDRGEHPRRGRFRRLRRLRRLRPAGRGARREDGAASGRGLRLARAVRMERRGARGQGRRRAVRAAARLCGGDDRGRAGRRSRGRGDTAFRRAFAGEGGDGMAAGDDVGAGAPEVAQAREGPTGRALRGAGGRVCGPDRDAGPDVRFSGVGDRRDRRPEASVRR